MDNRDLSFFYEYAAASPDGIIICDSSRKCTFINSAACQILNIKESQILQKPIKTFFAQLEHPFNYNKFCQSLEAGESFSCLFSLDQTEFSIHGFKVGEQFILSIYKISSDIVSEAKLKNEMDTLLSNISSQVFFKNNSFEYTSVNQACAAFHGLPVNEMIGKTDFELFPKEQAEAIREDDKKVIFEGRTINNAERPLFNQTGEMVWVSTTKTPIKNAQGKITGLLGISLDITAIKVARAEIELLASAVTQAPEMIMITDLQGNIQYINPAFENTTGYSSEEMIGSKPSLLKSGNQDDAFYADLWKTLKSGKSWNGIFSNKKKDGALFDCESLISPVKSKEGVISNYIAFMKDITNEKQLEQQLRQSQKMDAIGRLAGGIAHDFNNILTAILGYAELVLMKLDKNDQEYHKINEIKKAAKRAAALTGHMLAFSKMRVYHHKDIKVNDIISDMAAMLHRIIGENIKLTLELDNKLDLVKSNRTYLEQIILNLVINAKEAMNKKGGKILIVTRNTFLKSEFKNANFTAPPGPYVLVSVQDEGCGIGDETIELIFEPFFTKKKSSKGTGLGLSTVYGIVKQHDGYIEVESTVGQGSIFNIYLPTSSGGKSSPYEETNEEEGVNIAPISKTVLVVEDEAQLLELTATVLKLAGYVVITALSAEEALEKLNSAPHIDLLLTDIVLGGMNGYDLSLEARKIIPELKVLFMTGYIGQILNELKINYSENDFIVKPFTIPQLTKKVNEQFGFPSVTDLNTSAKFRDFL